MLDATKKAINYSGYRNGQSPWKEIYPSKDEILEDLMLLNGEFSLLRIYDCSPHAHRVLEVIKEHQLEFKVMLGLSLAAEENHINHPYYYKYSEQELMNNQLDNNSRIDEIIMIASQYKEIVNAISIGNETRSKWNNNRVPIERLIDVAKVIQKATPFPVTFCEEYHTWIEELNPLADVLDFIGIHTYPAWQGSDIEQALDVLVNNYREVKNHFPNKLIHITETGWPTKSHGSRIKVENATITNQLIYNQQVSDWGMKNGVAIYIFEAFDESWKGDNHPDEPEKNWGIYDSSRQRKSV